MAAGGRLPAGTLIRRPGVASALETIVAEGRSGFYQGPFGEGLLRLGPGLFSPEDLDTVQAEWVEPLHMTVWGHEVLTPPPPSQGYLTLAAAAVAECLDLHPNTIRWHLGVLERAGIADSRPAAGGKPGRPRMLYHLRPGAGASTGTDEHRLLATALTGALAKTPDGAERAREAGRAWGSYLVRRPSPLHSPSDEEAVAEVAVLAETVAAEPTAVEDEPAKDDDR